MARPPLRTRWIASIAVLAALCLFLLAPSARAAMMYHHDLRSLFVMSDAVVKAKRLGERTLGPYQKVTTFRVLKVWQGPLSAGETFQIAGPSAYDFGQPSHQGPEPTPDDVMVLFLQPADDQQRSRLQAPWLIASSGLRVLLEGRVQRFEQYANPGLYVPVPQGRDPDDVTGVSPASEGLTMPQFEAQLDEAKRRADAMRAAIASKRPERMVEALGPPLSERRHGEVGVGLGFFADLAATQLLEQLDRAGDVAMFLEGVSRARTGIVWYHLRDLQITDGALLGVARDHAAPTHRRLAALTVLEARWRPGEVAEVGRALPLLDDPDPTLRAAAVPVLAGALEPARIAPAIVARWRTEAHPGAQVALLKAAQRLDIVGDLERDGRPDVVVSVRRELDVLDIELAWFGTASWHVAERRLLLRSAGRDVRAIDLTADGKMISWTSSGSGGAQRRIVVDPPLPPGAYDVTATLRLERFEPPGSVDVSRSLGPWTLGPPPSPEPEPEPAEGAAEPAPVEVEPLPAPKRRPSCGCAVPGGEGEAPPPWLPVALAALAALRRGRRRARELTSPSTPRTRASSQNLS